MPPKWIIRFAVYGTILAGVAYFLSPLLGTGGGQSLLSPDGRFDARVWRRTGRSSPFRVTIVDTQSNQVLSQFQITPVDGIPQQPARGGPRIFEWSPDSRQLHLRLDDRDWGTIRIVPSAEEAPPP